MIKILTIALALTLNLKAQSQSHRPLSSEEKDKILTHDKAEILKEAGTSYAVESEVRGVEFALMEEFHKKGKISQKLSEGYIQHLTNRGLSKVEINRRVSGLMKGYFNNLQVISADQALSESQKESFKKQLENASDEEADKIYENIKQEIAKSNVASENEEKSEKFASYFLKASEKDYEKKEMPLPSVDDMELLVPQNFSLNNEKVQSGEVRPEIYCLKKKARPVSEEALSLVNSLNEVISTKPESKKKGIQEIWVAWGYNRDWHSKSDAMFKTLYGDFTIHDAYGDDVPKKFGIYYFDPEKISIPQYNIEIGVMFNDKWGMDLHVDHMKWKFDRLRDYKITGDFSKKVWSTRGSRKTFDEAKKDMDASWLRFEHTDGYNYISLGLIRNFKIAESKSGNFDIDARVSAGGGLMVPRTDVRLYYQKDDGDSNRYGINNKFHVAGYGVHSDARLKFTFWDKVFLQATVRGSRIKIKNALVDGSGASLEHTPINSLQVIGQIGYQHKFKMKSKEDKVKEEIKKRK